MIFSLLFTLIFFILSDSDHCCGSTQAAIRLAISALVGVATATAVVYDIRYE